MEQNIEQKTPLNTKTGFLEEIWPKTGGYGLLGDIDRRLPEVCHHQQPFPPGSGSTIARLFYPGVLGTANLHLFIRHSAVNLIFIHLVDSRNRVCLRPVLGDFLHGHRQQHLVHSGLLSWPLLQQRAAAR